MKGLLTLLLICLGTAVSAQIKQGSAFLDSLLADLPRIRPDTNGVLLLVNIAYRYSTGDPARGIHYADSALRMSRALGWEKGQGLAYNELGNNYRQQAELPAALENYYRALRIAESAQDEGQMSKVYLNIGSVFYDQQAYAKAMTNFSRSLEAARHTGDRKLEQLATGNIGNIYYSEENYPLALRFMQESLRIAREAGNSRGIIQQAGNIANVYGSMGNNAEALRWYAMALETAEAIGDEQLQAVNAGNIGETYLDIARTLGNPGRRHTLDSAVYFLEKGIAGARKIGFSGAVVEFSRVLAEAYSLQGRYQVAFTTHQDYVRLKDSVFSLENNALLADLETRREVALKDKDIQIAKLAVEKKQAERWFYIGGITLLLLIMAMLWRSFRRQQHSNTLLSREKKRSDDLLLNILPAGVAEELKESGVAEARQYDGVSVLFTDFVNFTGRAEALSPTALVRELHECFSAFDAICERHGLEKIKTIGDAYMAVCGVPVADLNHAVNTTLAAVEIRRFIAARREHQLALEIRIGINSGSVVAGIVGVKKFAYDIWGDAVNTAARMEQHGLPGAINISRSTYDLVRETFDCTYRGKISAKHKGEVEMYIVNAAVEAPPGP